MRQSKAGRSILARPGAQSEAASRQLKRRRSSQEEDPGAPGQAGA